MSANTSVDYSQIESETLHLKIGRCNSTIFNEKNLLQQILSEELDICRLKISAADEMASFKLSKLGMPFFFSGSIRRYKTKIQALPSGDFIHKNLQYEIYDGTQNSLLKFMLTDTWGTYPIGYYRSPLLNKLVNKKKEIESVFRFYQKFNNYKNFPDNCILFIRDKDEYVGFFALNVVNGNLESHIGGICKKHQQSGYFYDMLRYIKEYCYKSNLAHFVFGARNENTVVQKIFENVGFKGIDTENVFHIAPLLTFSKAQSISRDIKLSDWNLKTITKSITSSFEKQLTRYSFGQRSHLFNLTLLKKSGESKSHRISMHIPIDDKNETLAVFKVYDTDDKLAAFAYEHMFKS